MALAGEWYEHKVTLQELLDEFTDEGSPWRENDYGPKRPSDMRTQKKKSGGGRMSREEAINILQEIKEFDDSMYQYNEAYMSALNMAIKGLEAWEKVEEDLNGDFSGQTKGFRYGIDYALLAIADCFAGVGVQSD